MITQDQALASLPYGLRDPLIQEFNNIVNNFVENRWSSSEISGGKFSEIVYTILDGYSMGNYASSPSKPRNMVEACRRLENNASNPRSFQILIPRILPALYEIRNNRGVGHVGGDVNPNFMDSSVVVSLASWILSELIRVFHNTTIDEAQELVNHLVERRIHLVWKSGEVRRVLGPHISIKDKTLILINSTPGKVDIDQLIGWLDSHKRPSIFRVIKKLHIDRFVEYDSTNKTIEILPPGSDYIANYLRLVG